jgi:hypothetical protein
MPYIGNTIRAADDYRLIDDISSSFNGSTTSFALQVAGSAPVPFPKSPQQVLISVNGVIQEPDPTGASGFNLVGTNIVFSSAPTNGHAFFGIIYATADYLNSGGNFPSGSLGAPSITFIGDEDSGLYRKGAGSVGFVSDATEIANFDSNGITISSGNIIIPDSIIHNGDPNTKIRFPASDIVSVETSGTERLRIDASGRLLIGITTPRSPANTTAQVQLEGTNASLSSFSLTRNSGNTGGPKLILNKTRGTSVGADTTVNSGDTLGSIQWVGNDGTDSDNIAAEIRAEVDGTPGSDDMPGRLVFRTTADGANTSTERMRIDSSGFVGIGTTTPNFLVDVETDGSTEPVIRIFNQGTAASADSRLRLQTGGSGATSQNARIEFGNADDTDNGMIRYFTGSGERYFAFLTNASERMRLDANGRLLINRTSGDFPLDVNGAARISDKLYMANDKRIEWGSSDVSYIQGNDNENLIFAVSSERMRIDSQGRVGIGTNSPDNELHIKDSTNDCAIEIEATATDADSRLKLIGHSGGLSEVRFGDQDDGDIGSIRYLHTNNSMILRTNNSDHITLDSNGNLGIGGVTPEAILHVKKNDSTAYDDDATDSQVGVGPTIYLENNSNTNSGLGGQIVFSQRSTEEQCRIGATGGTSPSLFFSTDDTEVVRINNSSNIGIGTTSPQQDIHLQKTAAVVRIESTSAGSSARLELKSINDTYNGIHFGDADDIDRGRIRYYHTSDSMLFYTSADEHMRIHANGNITADDNADVLLGNPTDRNISSSDDDDPLHFDAVRLTTGGMSVTNTNSRVTVPTTGKYMVYAMVSGSSTSNNQIDGIQFRLLKNGSVINSAQDFPIGSFGESGEEYTFQFTYMANCAANDYLEVCFDNVDAGTASLGRGYFGVYLVH